MLRDIVRILSDGDRTSGGAGPFRIGVADERSEIAAVWDGVPQMDIGSHTDVIDACPKSLSILMLLRAMNPQIIAVDEITAKEDVEAMIRAAHCGCGLIATAHAEDIEDMKRRAMYRDILDGDIFKKIVVIEKSGGKRRYAIRDVEECKCSG